MGKPISEIMTSNPWREVATTDLVTCDLQHDFDGALRLTARHRYRRLPVVGGLPPRERGRSAPRS